MAETSGASETSGSAGQVAAEGHRSDWSVGDSHEGPHVASRRAGQFEFPDGIHNDDSFSSQQFVSPPPGSWESQSFDSEEPSLMGRTSRPSSRTSLRDRRKMYDVNTPTLIDEEDEFDNEAQGTPSWFSEDDASGRRTPGAMVYKASIDPSSVGLPGDQTHATTVVQPMKSGESGKDAAPLGFGLTLTTPVASSLEASGRKPERNNFSWDGVSSPGATDSHKSDASTPTDVKTPRPPLAPAVAASSTGVTRAEDSELVAGGVWNRPSGHVRSNSSNGDGRTGAFSPNGLRIQENVRNLLKDDEDDEYTIDPLGVFRGVEQGTTEGKDWTGSYVFSPEDMSSRPGVPRDYAHRREGTTRQASGVGQGMLDNIHQPKPMQGFKEGIEFGKSRGDERASPQLINFQSAPANPSNGSFMRPVAATARRIQDGNSASMPAFGQPSFHFGVPPESNLCKGEPKFGRSYAPTQQSHPPSHFIPATPAHYAWETKVVRPRPSEMQATAREFVPARGPQPPGQQWPQQGNEFEPSFVPNGWPPMSPMFGFTGNYPYGFQGHSFVDPRVVMTPSPHPAMWHSTMSPLSFDHPHGSRSSLTPTPPQTHMTGASCDFVQRESHAKSKPSKQKGKRGKKKTPKEKSDAQHSGKKTPTPRKHTKEQSRNSQGQEGEDSAVSTSDDPTKRIEKEFYKNFRYAERVSYHKAEEFARQTIESPSFPESLHWCVYNHLADLARRSNRFPEARQLYEKVCQIEPYVHHGWLEYSKLEEECGNMKRVINILYRGLEYCENHDNLMIRTVKLHEKSGNLALARALLARLKHIPMRKAWKAVLEGALLEARAGNVATSRRVLKYLMHHVPWYGPLYLEAYRLERDHGNIEDALVVVRRGLRQIPRYGPLWFGALRLCEELDYKNHAYSLPSALLMVEEATHNITKELVWKVHLEAAQMLERALQHKASPDGTVPDEMLNPARRRFALTILTCPDSNRNLLWKVWLAAARTELGFGHSEKARHLFLKAHTVVPDKGKSSTLLECGRLEEFLGDTELARAILCRGRRDYGYDWKVWLESVLLEIREGCFHRAIEICSDALEVHNGTGRLWASLVQLKEYGGGDVEQRNALKHALNAVPKSGEVWCEGGRIYLNPFSKTFDIDRARRHLHFAAKFTPQYGDSFVEGIRLEILKQWLTPVADQIWETVKPAQEKLEALWNDKESLKTFLAKVSLDMSLTYPLKHTDDKEPSKNLLGPVSDKLTLEALKTSIDLSTLRLACANADPNYGALWFFCRKGASDTTRKVIENAAELVTKDLFEYGHVYLAAMLRRKAILAAACLERPALEGHIETSDRDVAAWEDEVDDVLSSSLSLSDIINSMGSVLATSRFSSHMGGSLFVTGLSNLNKRKAVPTMNLAERKRALFGNDALFT